MRIPGMPGIWIMPISIGSSRKRSHSSRMVMMVAPSMLPVSEPEPAGHDKHEHVESQQEIEHLGVDCGKMAAEQAAADASEKAPMQKESTLY